MTIKLYNTLTREKQDLSPIEPGKVKIYTCGLTVYDYAHIGNLRSYIFADILHRTLVANSLEVNLIENITDVGHLVGDGDEGEDKMAMGARKTGKSALEIAEYFTNEYKKDRESLNILPPTKWVKATDTIPEQIEFVKELEQKGFTYKITDGIYFDTSKLSDYGKLAHLDIAGLREGARVTTNIEKRNLTDFALWKFSPAGPKREMEWESPWGIGFPGWHLECSAMSRKFLGFPFDIHTGGIDHVPVHHTNEIAQNEACCGQIGANIWMHNEHLLADGKKMSKSLGNYYTIRDIVAKGYSPLAFRYLCLGTHYRQKLNFTFESLDGAQSALGRLVKELATMPDWGQPSDEAYVNKFRECISDDLNTPKALAIIWEVIEDKSRKPEDKQRDIIAMDAVLGLRLEKAVKTYIALQANIPDEVKKLVAEREEARMGKDWGRADELRAKIEQLGWIVKDAPEGPGLEPL
jgi:cysteinyl-tRNA synthetase